MPGITSKLPEGWERSETSSGIPYYINHETECTHWDHPEMVKLNQDIAALNNIKYAAYRTAMKLRAIQKKTQMYLLELPVIISSLQAEDISDGYTENPLTAADVQEIISTIFISQNGDRQDFINIPLASDLTFNWILNVFDPGRTGFVQSISLKVGLSVMCAANLQDKYKYIFRQLCNSNSVMERKRLKLFLQEALQIPKNISENAVFCGTSVEPAVRNCFERNAGAMNQINLDEFLDWMIAEPQTIVWLPTLHRLAVSESVKHEAKCNICKLFPIVGFRYRCLKCFNFDLCQECFWSGRINKGHKVGHPTQEYCLAPSQKEDIKDFAKVMKNKVSKKKKSPKDPAKGRYISIANEDAPPFNDEYSVDAPPRIKKYNSDTHKKLGSYAARLADYDEIDDKPRDSTPRSRSDLDEHRGPIHHQYPSSRSQEPFQTETTLQLRSPTEVGHVLDPSQQDELEGLISNLENDNRALRDEIDRIHQLQLQNLSLSTLDNSDEADLLRQRKERLLAREEVLESHNQQLEIQLNRLRSLLHQGGSGVAAQKPRSSQRTDNVLSTTIPYQPTPLPRAVSPQTRGFSTEQNREHAPGLDNPPQIPRVSSLQARSQPTMMYPSGVDRNGTEIRGVSGNQTRLNQEDFSSRFQPTGSLPGLRTADNEFRGVSPQIGQQYQPAVGASPYLSTPAVNGQVTSNMSFNATSSSVPPLLRFSPSHAGFRSPTRIDSSRQEAELQNIVDRMTSSFPLDAESDISMEIHSDLFLAAAMVGEAMQSLVSAVSRQRGHDYSDPSLSYNNYTTGNQYATNSSIPMARNEWHSFDSSSGYVEEYGAL